MKLKTSISHGRLTHHMYYCEYKEEKKLIDKNIESKWLVAIDFIKIDALLSHIEDVAEDNLVSGFFKDLPNIDKDSKMIFLIDFQIDYQHQADIRKISILSK